MSMEMLDVVAAFQGLSRSEVVQSLHAAAHQEPLCVACDPYEYRNTVVTVEGEDYMMCHAHRTVLGRRRRPPHLPYPFQPSWKRGIWG